ncbi:hypothetical protein SAMN05421540_1252 [Psychroflexus halocasei]|uniref:Uncharacterized protein n=1 Tax=Psychroflexus halocasei TaxID=908615 RepID=A0A1H4E361_9FLAO|nr:hypothetical protein SAMN05421540_1252 [Psychroflexus halocasei]
MISCVNQQTASDIDVYVKKINNRTDLIDSKNKFKTKIENGKLAEFTINTRTDKKGDILRINAKIDFLNKKSDDYTFYFENDTLNFAHIIKFMETDENLDTITNSEFYFFQENLIKQIDEKEKSMEAKTVQQLSEFYLVFGKETAE